MNTNTITNGHVIKTICDGTVKYVLDKQNVVVTMNFVDVKRCVMCGKCEFDMYCSELLKDEKASQQPETPEETKIPATVILIQVRAFTGMPIGDMQIIKEGKKYIEVTTKKGQIIRFNRHSGLQTNCVNPKFANRVDPKHIPAWVHQHQPAQPVIAPFQNRAVTK